VAAERTLGDVEGLHWTEAAGSSMRVGKEGRSPSRSLSFKAHAMQPWSSPKKQSGASSGKSSSQRYGLKGEQWIRPVGTMVGD